LKLEGEERERRGPCNKTKQKKKTAVLAAVAARIFTLNRISVGVEGCE
jgi:hypothetical protein